MYDYISHYGVKRRSGRYPWGSGDNPYQGDDKNQKKGRSKKKHKESLKEIMKRAREAFRPLPMSEIRANFSKKADPKKRPSQNISNFIIHQMNQQNLIQNQIELRNQNRIFNDIANMNVSQANNFAMTGMFF